jgi:hypothetical protein
MQNKATEFLAEITRTVELFSNQISEVSKKMLPEEKRYEVVEPYFFSKDFRDKLKLPLVYRLNQQGMRYYYTIDNSTATFYPSVTTIIEKTTPLSYGLKKLIGDLGLDEYRKYMDKKAHYGTLMHMLVASYLRSAERAEDRYFDLDMINTQMSFYAAENSINYDISDWEWSLKKDILAFIAFVNEYHVEPIAVEVVGVYNKNGIKFAGTLDLLCQMTISEKGYWGETYKTGDKKGEPKETNQDFRVTAVVDFKSGKSGFFDDHEIQLHMYKMIAEESFNIEVEKVFNWAPKDWISSPTFSLKDQTLSENAKKIPYLLGAFQTEWEDPKEFTIINGKVNGANLTKNIKKVSAQEYVLSLISSNN